MSNLSKLKEKILKLRAMIPEKGASESEALAALMKADALMAEHGLSEADLKTAEAARDMGKTEFKYGIQTQHPCAKWCSRSIGEFCGVATWYDSSNQTSNGFGFNGDVEMYEFLLKMVHDTMNREWKDYVKLNKPIPGISRHTEYWSFMLGLATAVREKLESLMEQREVMVDSTGTDLVIIKSDIVVEALAATMPALNLKKSRPKGIAANQNAMDQGTEAGNRINSSRPIKNGPSGKKLLA